MSKRQVRHFELGLWEKKRRFNCLPSSLETLVASLGTEPKVRGSQYIGTCVFVSIDMSLNMRFQILDRYLVPLLVLVIGVRLRKPMKSVPEERIPTLAVMKIRRASDRIHK
jgi:hypothetical protein